MNASAGELTALIGVEDLRRAETGQGLLRASTQKSPSIVFDSRHASTCRLNQSKTATRYKKPRAIGM